jgi:hypothetical protein
VVIGSAFPDFVAGYKVVTDTFVVGKREMKSAIARVSDKSCAASEQEYQKRTSDLHARSLNRFEATGMAMFPLATNTVVVNFEQLAANALNTAVDVILLDTTFWGRHPQLHQSGWCLRHLSTRNRRTFVG